MGHIIECLECGRKFNKNNHNFCPGCKAEFDDPDLVEKKTISEYYDDSPKPTSKKSSSASTKLQQVSKKDPLVEAQDRTTHAVRSLAISFVAAPVIAILVIGMIALALNSGDTVLVIVSILVGAGISLWTLFASLNELAKSKVPEN